MKRAAAPAENRVSQLIQEGLELQRANRLTEAAERYERALQIDAGSFDALQLLGTLRFRAGDIQTGIHLLERALGQHPDHAPTLNNLGNALRAAGRLPEALAAYERAARLFPKPVPPVVLRNLGSALLDAGDAARAGPLLREAAAREPQDAVAWCWLGHHARAERRPADAAESYLRALQAQPALAEAQRGLGSAYSDLRQYRNAAEAFGRTLTLQPNYLLAAIAKADAELALGEWAGFTAAVSTVEQSIPQPGHMINALIPARLTDDPAVLRRYADAYAALHAGQSTQAGVAHSQPGSDRTSPNSRIRIGYLSADLCDHPVGRLLAGVVEHHDHSAFDVQLLALDAGNDSEVRQRLATTIEPLHLGSLSDGELATRLREMNLDVLVDLMGYTEQHRVRAVAARTAPVQVSWLGYPGTLGGSLADYLIADAYTVPEGSEQHYAEQIVRLPDCLLPGDHSRTVNQPLQRSAYGLPANAVVFCCFSQTRKINPLVFDVWMDVMREIPESVLWLAAEAPDVTINLRRAAQDRGVDAGRIVFAPRLPSLGDHLAQYCVADLALDTFPYSSHSTAIDALWTGCPLVARIGRGFAARVSGSVLNTIGMPELIASSDKEYRELIVLLASDPARRAQIRTRLLANRSQCALFDAHRFTRALERAFFEMTRRSQANQAPEHLWIQ